MWQRREEDPFFFRWRVGDLVWGLKLWTVSWWFDVRTMLWWKWRWPAQSQDPRVKAGEDEQLGTLEGVGEMIKRPVMKDWTNSNWSPTRLVPKKWQLTVVSKVKFGWVSIQRRLGCSFVSSNLPVLDAKWFEKLSYDRWSVPTMRPRLWWTACIFFETWSDSEVGWFICKGKPSSQLLEINHEKVSIILNTSHLLRSTDEALEANHGSNGHGMPRHSEVASGPAISVCIFLKLGVFHCFPLFVFQLELFHFLMTIHHSNWKTPTTNPGVFRHIVWWVFPRMERETPAAWHLPGEANYGRLYEWHQFLPTRCLNLRGVTRRLQSQYFPPVLTEKMSQKEASEIYPWKGHPPKEKMSVCVC